MKKNSILFILLTLIVSSMSMAKKNGDLSEDELYVKRLLETPISQIIIDNSSLKNNLIDNYDQVEDTTITVRGIDQKTGDIDILFQFPNGDTEVFKGNLQKQKSSGKWRIKGFQGYYVDTKLNKIIQGNLAKRHKSKTDVRGIEVGRVIYENFKGWPLDIVGVLGIAQHNDKEFQGKFLAYTAGLKLEWKKFPWDKYVRTKIEFIEGVNYANKVPHFEGLHVREKNDGRDSKLLNYLGVGIALNLGDLTRSKELENCYIGAYAYHRSGVFGSVDLYGNVDGGSNYQTASIECYY